MTTKENAKAAIDGSAASFPLIGNHDNPATRPGANLWITSTPSDYVNPSTKLALIEKIIGIE